MEQEKIKYPIGQQDFASIREEGFVYIDKTGLIYDLVKGSKYIFLARPRRFGKSLLLSTIRYYFEGRKELFKGLEIERLEKDWAKYPVLFLELSRIRNNEPKSLMSALEEQFTDWEKQYDITDVENIDFSQRFSRIIKSAYSKTGCKVVILIDEYDNPLINTIHNQEIYESNRNLLKSVYSNLKALDEYIRFAMLTGVSRFSNTTVFSGLNNIKDISFYEDYSTICGFTNEEIRANLWPGVERLGNSECCTSEEALFMLKQEYDGYHFSDDMTDIYNPFSLLNCLDSRRIDNYWIQSGVPEFLIRKLQGNSITYQNLFSSEGTSATLSVADAAFDSPVALFYQTGYLTIKGYDRSTRRYRLGIPNKEVDEGLFQYLLAGYYDNNPYEADNRLASMTQVLRKGDAAEFMGRLQELLAGISYQLNSKMTELDFERMMYVIFHVLGFHIHCELTTSRGRIDLLVETKDYVYVMELKLDRSANEALTQIESKEYALPWKYDGRKVFKIGISFSSQTRNITEWEIEEDYK